MQLEEWLSKNELVVNTQKIFVMYFHNRHNYLCEKPRVMYNNKELNYCSQSKLLGLHITENLNWKNSKFIFKFESDILYYKIPKR